MLPVKLEEMEVICEGELRTSQLEVFNAPLIVYEAEPDVVEDDNIDAVE